MPIYYVSDISGNDSFAGSILDPFKTIQKAANIAKPGDTINVYYGIYRERVSPVLGGSNINNKISPIIYNGIPNKEGKSPIIRGSTIWTPTINNSSNIWSGVLDESLFTDNSAIDGANPFKVPFSVTPYGINGLPEMAIDGIKPTPNPKISYCLGQVFVNDEMYIQKPLINEMYCTEKTWNYDISLNVLTIHFPTNDLTDFSIEITNQRRLFAPHVRGLRYITVNGFVLERCGNNYPNRFWVVAANQQAGALGTRSGRFWTIINNTIRFASGVGIDWGNEGGSTQDLETGLNGTASGSFGHIIINNVISDNGAAGTAAFMSNNFTFSNNKVFRNNNLLFYGKQRWESAGLKVHTPRDSMISNNTITDNYCNGIWCDQGISSGTIQNNILSNNDDSGINIEIGAKNSGMIRENTFDNNKYGVYLVTSGGVTIQNNTFVFSKDTDIKTIYFTRTDKWDPNNVVINDNIFDKTIKKIVLDPKSANYGASSSVSIGFNTGLGVIM